MDSLDDLRIWLGRMRERTRRSFDRIGSTPAGWHVLLPDGEFGFLDVKMPTGAEEHSKLVAEASEYMRDMRVRACLFVAEHELADGRPALFLQHEAMDAKGKRHRATELFRIAASPEGRVMSDTPVLPDAGRDRQLLESGMFPDLIPDPPSPLRIL